MNMSARFTGVVFLVVSMLLLAGCAGGPRLSPYPEANGANAVPVRSFNQNGLDLMIPAGWRYEAPSPNSGEAFKGQFTKDGATISVMCFNSSFLTRLGLWDAMTGAVNGSMPVNTLVKGPYEVNTSGVKPIFEAYEGEVVHKGQPVKMVMFTASKWTRGFGCKYGLTAIAPLSAKDAVEGDFIAVVRSLKN